MSEIDEELKKIQLEKERLNLRKMQRNDAAISMMSTIYSGPYKLLKTLGGFLRKNFRAIAALLILILFSYLVVLAQEKYQEHQERVAYKEWNDRIDEYVKAACAEKFQAASNCQHPSMFSNIADTCFMDKMAASECSSNAHTKALNLFPLKQ